MIEYLDNCCGKREVSDIKFDLLYEFYLAISWMHTTRYNILKIGNRVCVINFRSTGIEIDVCLIEELGGHFMNFIKKIKREFSVILNEGSDLFFEQIPSQKLLHLGKRLV